MCAEWRVSHPSRPRRPSRPGRFRGLAISTDDAYFSSEEQADAACTNYCLPAGGSTVLIGEKLHSAKGKMPGGRVEPEISERPSPHVERKGFRSPGIPSHPQMVIGTESGSGRTLAPETPALRVGRYDGSLDSRRAECVDLDQVYHCRPHSAECVLGPRVPTTNSTILISGCGIFTRQPIASRNPPRPRCLSHPRQRVIFPSQFSSAHPHGYPPCGSRPAAAACIPETPSRSTISGLVVTLLEPPTYPATSPDRPEAARSEPRLVLHAGRGPRPGSDFPLGNGTAGLAIASRAAVSSGGS